MKFEKFVSMKNSNKSYSINESAYTLNEAEESGFMATIKSGIAYIKAKGLLSKYEEAAHAADTAYNKALIDAKKANLMKKWEALENKKANLPNNKKEPIIAQQTKIKDVMGKLDDGLEAKQNSLNDKLTNIKSDLDEQTNLIQGTLKNLITGKMTIITQEAKQAGLEAAKKVADAKGKKERAVEIEKELAEIQDKIKVATEKVSDGESDSEEDLAEIGNIEMIKDELPAFMAASKELKKVNTELNSIWTDADQYVEVDDEDNNSVNFDDYISSLTEDDLWEDDLFEDTKDKSKTPDVVRGKIMAGAADDADKRKALMSSLETAIGKWKTALQKQVDTKAAMWEKIKGKPATKSVITVVGGDAEKAKENEDGTFTCSELSPKWAALIDKTEESPLVKIDAVEAKIKDEDLPKLDKEIEDMAAADDKGKKAPAEEEVKKSGAEEAAQNELVAAKEKLKTAEADENIGSDELQALKDVVSDKEEKLSAAKEKKDESNSTVEETTSPKPSNTIMKFADFVARGK